MCLGLASGYIKHDKKQKMAHGKMIYQCEGCGLLIEMLLEEGIESFDEHHKPTPFCVYSKCCSDVFMHDVSGIIKFDELKPIGATDSYFANKKEHDCGIPVINVETARKRYMELESMAKRFCAINPARYVFEKMKADGVNLCWL